MLEKEKFRDLTQQIAKILHYDWSQPEDWGDHRTILTKGSQQIYIDQSESYSKDRLRIWGSFPRAKDGQWMYEKSPEISVTDRKDATQICQDISKRLLPEYTGALAHVKEKIDQRNTDIELCEESLNVIAKAMGTAPTKWGKATDGHVHSYEVGIKAEYRYDGIFKVEVTMSTEQLLEFIQWHKARKESKDEKPSAHQIQVHRPTDEEQRSQLAGNENAEKSPGLSNTAAIPNTEQQNSTASNKENVQPRDQRISNRSVDIPPLTDLLTPGDFEQLFQDGEIDAEELSVYTDLMGEDEIPDDMASWALHDANIGIQMAKDLRKRIIDHGGIASSDYQDIPPKYKRKTGLSMDVIAQEMGYEDDAALYSEIQEAEHILRQRPTKDGKVQQQFKIADLETKDGYTIEKGETIWEQQAAEAMYSKKLTTDTEIPF